MITKARIAVNDPCPCGSLRKFKKCCRGRVPWENYVAGAPLSQVVPHLSVRGKNLAFIDRIAGALQLDKLPNTAELKDFKRAFTPMAVRRIFEAIVEIWPSADDLDRALRAERASTSAIYSGFYDPPSILQGVTRHTLYSDTILLVDPFPTPRFMRDEFSPLLKPEMHRSTALRWTTLWFAFSPWIEAGLVKFVRTPGDFDVKAEQESMEAARERFERDPELKALLKRQVEESDQSSYMASYKKAMVLVMPDEYLRQKMREYNPSWPEEKIDAVMKALQRQRDEHPYFIEPLAMDKESSELQHLTSGTTFGMAKETAILTGSHFITDMPTRWREIELDRETSSVDVGRWSPFAKAFQGLTFDYLENVPLEAALLLRQEGRLEDLRAFLRKVWRASSGGDAFGEEKIANLAAELHQRVNEAEAEWIKIKRELTLFAGGQFAVGALTLPLVAPGEVEWKAAAVVATGLANLAGAAYRRREFRKQYPAGFFLKLQQRRPS